MRVLRLGLVVFVVGVLGAGCATVGGSAAPIEPSAGVTAPVAPVEPTGVVLPPRPRDVRVDGVDPCSLLTDVQRAELGLEQKSLSDSAPSLLYVGEEVPQCTLQGFAPRAVVVAVSLVPMTGIDFWTSGGLGSTIRATSVSGFPAVVAIPSRFTDFCNVAVDVAPGQLVDVLFSDGGRPPPIPQDQLCADGEKVARSVMATLLAR